MSSSLRPELGSGPLTAPLYVIGRDFGTEEARARQPFVGPAGQILDSTLAFAGIDRRSIRIDNLVPAQPAANDFAAHTPEILAWGKARLNVLLREHRPRLVVALGDEVARWLLGPAAPTDGVQSYRGYLWDTPDGSPVPGLRVLTTVHPAGVLRDWTPWRALLNLDMRRAKAELANGCPALDTREVTIVTSRSQLDDLRSAIAGGVGRGLVSPWLATDIENTGDLRLACVGFAPSPQRAWTIPAEQDWQLAAIRELCESDVPKVLQNGQYDRFFLRRFAGIELRAQAFDTMLAWHALQPELAGKRQKGARKGYSRSTVKSLRFLGSIYCRTAFHKNYDFANDDERYVLCGRDCCMTLEVALKQEKQLA